MLRSSILLAFLSPFSSFSLLLISFTPSVLLFFCLIYCGPLLSHFLYLFSFRISSLVLLLSRSLLPSLSLFLFDILRCSPFSPSLPLSISFRFRPSSSPSPPRHPLSPLSSPRSTFSVRPCSSSFASLVPSVYLSAPRPRPRPRERQREGERERENISQLRTNIYPNKVCQQSQMCHACVADNKTTLDGCC